MPRHDVQVPVEPFQEILAAAFTDRTFQGIDPSDPIAHRNLGLRTPLEQISEALAEKLNTSYATVARRVYSVRYGKVRSIGFDFADAIVCCFSSPVVFLTDERLTSIYESIGGEG